MVSEKMKEWFHYIPLVFVILAYHFLIGMAVLSLEMIFGFWVMIVIYSIGLYFSLAISDMAVHKIIGLD